MTKIDIGSDHLQLFKSSIYKKVVIVCLLLGFIPAIIVGGFSYRKASSTIQRKVQEGCINQLQQVEMSVEMQLSTVNKILMQMMGSPVILQSAKIKRTGTEFEAFENIENIINSFPSIGIPIYNISLVNVKQKWVVDKTEIYNLQDYEQKFTSMPSYIKEKKKIFWNDQAKIIDSTDQHLINCVTAVQKYTTPDGTYIGSVNIPYCAFKELVKTPCTTGTIMIVSSKGNTIYSDHNGISNADSFSASMFLKETGRKTMGNFNTEFQDSVLNITYIRSRYNGWYYVLITPMSEIVKDSNTILCFTFTVCGILIFLILAVSLILSKFACRPIQRIDNVLKREEFPPAPPVKNEIQQIEERVHQLISDRTDMRSKISVQAQKLKEYFVIKLLTTDNGYNLLKNRISLFGLPDTPPQMAIFVIQPNLVNQSQYQESDADILLYSIGNIVMEMFAAHSIALSSIIDIRQVTILSVEGDYKKVTHDAACQIKQFLQNQLELEVSVIISRPVCSYQDIHKSFNECLDTLYYHFLEDKSVAFVEDENRNDPQKGIYPKELEDEIIEAVKNCDRAKCSEMIHQFVTVIFDIESNHNVYKIYLMHLVVSLSIMHLQTVSNSKACQSDSEFVKQLYTLHGKKGIEHWLTNTVAESVMTQIEESADNHLKEICDSVLDIIHHDYSAKITLESCAEKLNYHPSYIRRVLKKEMGINFRSYLLQYRINIAKRWMIDTEMSITEIACRLQYENTENFIRSFKKAVGCTPKQYRDGKNVNL